MKQEREEVKKLVEEAKLKSVNLSNKHYGFNIITYNFQKRGICIYVKPNLNISLLELVFEECVWR